MLEGKVAIVTGAGNGIGRATALAFAPEGASVVVADVDRNAADKVAEESGSNAISMVMDVSDEGACHELADVAFKRFGRIDILFNNAGITGVRTLVDGMPSDKWRRVIDVNLNGVFYCTQSVLPHMRAAGGGVIINAASVDGLIGAAGVAPYVAAKHAVIGLTKTCALEYGPDSNRCVAIAPGFVGTEMVERIMGAQEIATATGAIPLRRMAERTEVAELVVWLASDKATYVTGDDCRNRKVDNSDDDPSRRKANLGLREANDRQAGHSRAV